MPISEEAQALREELRNGRISKADSTGGNPPPDGGGNDLAWRTTVQDAGRSTTIVQGSDNGHEERSTPGDHRTDSDTGSGGRSGRGTPRSIIRRRRDSRRPGESDGGSATSAEAVEPLFTSADRTVGNLVAEGPVPERPEGTLPQKKRDRTGYISPKRAAQKAAKIGEPLQEPKKPLLPQGKKLSASEADALSDPFAESMTEYFQYLDQYLWSRQEKAGKSSGQRAVWSDLDAEEMAALTRVFMKFGQHNMAAAAVVRGVIEARDFMTAGMIFGPRIALTREILIETNIPKQPRQRKQA